MPSQCVSIQYTVDLSTRWVQMWKNLSSLECSTWQPELFHLFISSFCFFSRFFLSSSLVLHLGFRLLRFKRLEHSYTPNIIQNIWSTHSGCTPITTHQQKTRKMKTIETECARCRSTWWMWNLNNTEERVCENRSISSKFFLFPFKLTIFAAIKRKIAEESEARAGQMGNRIGK